MGQNREKQKTPKLLRLFRALIAIYGRNLCTFTHEFTYVDISILFAFLSGFAGVATAGGCCIVGLALPIACFLFAFV